MSLPNDGQGLVDGRSLLAHGIGGSTDLPIPFLYAMVGASWALTISFAVLALAWKEPRFDEPGPSSDRLPRRPWLAVVGFVLVAWVLVALYGGPATADNGAMGAFYVLMWVGLVPLALLFGHVWRDLSPWRTIQSAAGKALGRPDGFASYPAKLGNWPAAFGLFAFVWLELASDDPGSVQAVRIWIAAYAVLMVAGGIAFGPRWFDRADPFDVYSEIVAKLSPFVRDGRRQLHNPLRTLPSVPIDRGLIAVLATLLGSTAYDSFSASSYWQSKTLSVAQHSLTLLAFVAVVATLFWLAARATGGLPAEERAALPGRLAHSLAPIVVGYILAHYLTFLVEKGQKTVIALGDPLGRGWQPFGDMAPSLWLSEHTSVLAALKVGFVVAGHVMAVIAAHDRALVVLPKAHRLSGQLAMLVLMVAYTFTGLFLLFSV
ncbi:MAG: hypothetical protein M3Q98_10820 [Actinomycetota bacterium]|nr:hypothetical protein [Actinomycetota bacterium]